MPTVIVKDGDDPSELAAALLKAAAPDKWRVRKVTSGRRPAFDVPDDVYAKFAGEHDDGDGAEGDSDAPPPEQPTDHTGTPADGVGDDPLPTGDFAPADEPTAPLVSGEPVIETGDDDEQPAGPDWASLGEAPDRNDRTDDWRAFLRPVLGDDVDTLNRTALIEAYDGRDA
ncbi:hypothetical protein SEA_AFFECA_22 [Gordonia phage Affeca]|uniref:Uncharacterized protein n=1 Tax=Gordonia phage Angelicage TaxID=2301695 RepID=A0A385DTK6_9CAUD|nr:hypothetical protein KNU06_gp22 [Gordonia phage Angelicage]AXQ62810.1 hypothetical protein SEA_ANGELICAGE_22 [Gordonia phage Angelicage]AYR02405.1 hypothetical protein SEA_AFFECA_22 [Gordonia phage Affeca]